jgi:hypothetical protein
MSYASLMAYIEADAAPEQRVRLAAGLAGRFAAQSAATFRSSVEQTDRHEEERLLRTNCLEVWPDFAPFEEVLRNPGPWIAASIRLCRICRIAGPRGLPQCIRSLPWATSIRRQRASTRHRRRGLVS